VSAPIDLYLSYERSNMLAKWLTLVSRNPSPHGFEVIDVIDQGIVDHDQLIDHLAVKLVEGLISTERLEEILNKAGLDKLLAVLRDRVVDRKLATLIGDFGEILVAQMIEEIDGYRIPIAKLRFREKRNWSMRLTDVFGIKCEGQQLSELCLCEVKTRTTWNKDCEQVGVDGAVSLKNDAAQRIPEIIDFVADKLRLTHNFDLANVLDTFLLSDDPASFPRRYLLVLIFDQKIWREIVLANMAGSVDGLASFSVRVTQIPELRILIDESYAHVLDQYDGRIPVPTAN
jgi:hypothetical protein